MAGIGFELKKAFQKKGLFALMRAYGYSGLVCTGPMILGITLLVGIRMVGELAGGGQDELQLLNSCVTYTLLFSLLITNTLSMVTTRYTADEIYTGHEERIMPSFLGSIGIYLCLGCPLYGVFLHFAGITLTQQFFCFLFYGELVIVWTQINYLTAIKDYRGILIAFSIAVGGSLVAGYLLTVIWHLPTVSALLGAVCIGYGIMALWYYGLLMKFFPESDCSALFWLHWIDLYPQLVWIGILIGLGLYGHLMIMWFSPSHRQVQGLFYETPVYDISALMAFFSILITTINFVTSVEVEFYPTYRNFFSLLNDEGAFVDIEQAGQTMKHTLIRELTYCFIKQFFCTLLFIIGGTMFLPMLPLGFTEDMLGIYRILCLAYAFYTTGNSMMLIQLYFADNKGALISTAAFSVISNIGSLLCAFAGIKWYGVGLLAGGMAFAFTSLYLLRRYVNKILANVLIRQPIKEQQITGMMTRISHKYQKRYEGIQRKGMNDET